VADRRIQSKLCVRIPSCDWPDSGHPLAGRSQGTIRVRRNSIALLRAHSASHLQVCKCQPRPVSHWSVARRIAPDIRRDQARRAALRAPWRRLPPQRNFGAKPCPRGRLHSAWLSPSRRRQSFGGSRRGRFSNLHACRWHQGGVQITFVDSHQSAILAHRPGPSRYAKHRFTSNGCWSRSM
jgi:hypothetical protein